MRYIIYLTSKCKKHKVLKKSLSKRYFLKHFIQYHSGPSFVTENCIQEYYDNLRYDVCNVLYYVYKPTIKIENN